jgi:hypothetical protein
VSFGFLIFLPADPAGTPGGYLPEGALLSLATEHLGQLERDESLHGVRNEVTTDDLSAPGVPPEVADMAGWINHHADLGSHDPTHPPVFRFLSISEYPVLPNHGVLYFEVPFDGAGETGRQLQHKAAELGLCMVDDMETLWVNPTGVPSGLWMRNSMDMVTTHVDRSSILAVLGEDVDRRRRADGGVPFVVIDVLDAAAPHGCRYAQAAMPGGVWVVEYRTEHSVFRLRSGAVAGPAALETVVRVLGDFTDYVAGDGDEFLRHEWEDASAELIG